MTPAVQTATLVCSCSSTAQSATNEHHRHQYGNPKIPEFYFRSWPVYDLAVYDLFVNEKVTKFQVMARLRPGRLRPVFDPVVNKSMRNFQVMDCLRPVEYDMFMTNS